MGMRASYLLLGSVCVSFALAGHPVQSQNAVRPRNLLLILADDLNADSMGWMGSKLGATPNTDAFARACHRFEQLHVSAPICQPSRAALLTGRVPHRNGALGFGPVNGDVPTLPEVLAARGYFTAAINKTQHMTPADKFGWNLSLEGSGKNPKTLRADVARAMREAGEKHQPYFINANITDPHRPFHGSQQRAAKPDEAEAPVEPYADAEIAVPAFLEDRPGVRKEVAQYFSSVRRFDESLREILAALEASGTRGNTVVVFLSDNGMSFPFSKATVYRSGTWAPTLLSWPGMGKPVVNAKDMVSSVDLMPTMLELLSVPAPAGMDGRSLLPLLQGKQQPGRDHVVTHVNSVNSGRSFPGRCVRSTTRSYIWNSWPDGKTRFAVEAMIGLSFRAMEEAAAEDPRVRARVQQYLYRTRQEFYDLEQDPDERRNLIDDPKYQGEIRTLRDLLLSHMRRTARSLAGGVRGRDTLGS
jgi:N-sulfoglucosamine sulfohydrolase